MKLSAKCEYVVYRCRRCGKEFRPLGGGKAIEVELDILGLSEGSQNVITPGMVEFHDCEDGKRGLGDLIGVDYSDEENKENNDAV